MPNSDVSKSLEILQSKIEALNKEVNQTLIQHAGVSGQLFSIEKNIARIEEQVKGLNDTIGKVKVEINSDMKSHYVNKDQFDPVKTIVYGVVSLILTAVVVALIALVVTG